MKPNEPKRPAAAAFARLIRKLGTALTRRIYRIRTVHPERLPRSGGALLLPNHVTLADSFFIATAANRDIRFVMDDAFTSNRWIRSFTKLFETVMIRREHAIEAIRTVIDAIGRGDLICLFPEGQLTRTGSLCPLQRGFTLITRKTGTHPVIPAWCDGSWGSLFSFERGRFLAKFPRRGAKGLFVAFGNPIPPGECSPRRVRDAMLEASADAITARFHCHPVGSRLLHKFTIPGQSSPHPDEVRRFLANGHQIGMLNALPWRNRIRFLADDPVPRGLHGPLTAFAILFGAKTVPQTRFNPSAGGCWIGGERLRDAIRSSPPDAPTRFLDFGNDATRMTPLPQLTHLPCLAIAERVVSMSLPDPPPPAEDVPPQHGTRTGSRGRLLPGWFPLTPDDGRGSLKGPAAPEGIRLPEGWLVDDEGFVMEA